MSSDSESSAPDPAVSAPPSESQKVRQRQNAAASAAVGSAGRLMERISQDATLRVALASYGLTAARLKRGAHLHADARRACEECAAVLQDLRAAEDARDAAQAQARRVYSEFRRCLKAACSERPQTDALELSATLRHSVRGLVVQATASYLAAGRIFPEHLLGSHGFDGSRLQAAVAQLEHLAGLDTAVAARSRQIGAFTKARDRAVGQLNDWVGELLRVAQLAFGRAAPPPKPARHRLSSPSAAALRQPLLRFASAIPRHRLGL